MFARAPCAACRDHKTLARIYNGGSLFKTHEDCLMRAVPADMAVIEMSAAGGPEVLIPGRRPVPAPSAGEVLIRVDSAGVNGPDIMQRKGLYPPPPGASDLLGLEVAGEIVALGNGVSGWSVGDTVDGSHQRRRLRRILCRRCAPLPADPQRRIAARCRRLAGDLLHGVEQHLHGGRPPGRRDPARARRRRRHWHHGNPTRQGLWG